VKVTETNAIGVEEEILYVKGSGWDLATIEEAGFAPVRLAYVRELANLPSLSDPRMVNELKTQMTRADAPTPSVETILHASLPYRYVDHTHADAVITVTNSVGGRQRIEEIYGDSVVIIPYIMPGFDLARLCAECFRSQAGSQTIGMVLMNHGIFSFGATARESYDRMIDLVDRAECYLQKQGVWTLATPQDTAKPSSVHLARLRADIAEVAGFPVILQCHESDRGLAFAQRPDVGEISQQGPATPDHVIRTKRVPLIGRDVRGYARGYENYFQTHASQSPAAKTILDRAPRVILDPELGLCTVGKTAKEAMIVADIYHHTIEIIERATCLGGYQALPAEDIFAVEYWDLEQAKLRQGGNPPPFTGEVALITGGASGIGKACVDSFLRRGAAVIALDIQG
jgi:rhamnose utilization protein RhaD (predicted bifunctional aldolase and dehydrogenase)